MKNIKKKNSLFTYFCKTDTGLALLCVGAALGFIFCLFVLPTLIGFLADQLTPLNNEWIDYTKYGYNGRYAGYFLLGCTVLACLGVITGTIYALIKFSHIIANDIKLAKTIVQNKTERKEK